MYDTIIFECAGCGKEQSVQTKVLGCCDLMNFVVGEKLHKKHLETTPNLVGGTWHSIMNEGLYNCFFKIKGKCNQCGKQNFIKIVDGKLVEVISDPNEEILATLDNVEEMPWGVTK